MKKQESQCVLKEHGELNAKFFFFARINANFWGDWLCSFSYTMSITGSNLLKYYIGFPRYLALVAF